MAKIKKISKTFKKASNSGVTKYEIVIRKN